MQNRMFGNVPLHGIAKEQVLKKLAERAVRGKKTRIFFLNAHCFNMAQKDAVYARSLQHAEMVLNDGIGVEIGAKILGVPLEENLNGTDFTPEVLKSLAKLGGRVYLLGGEPGIAQTAGKNIESTYPGIQVTGVSDGFFSDDKELLHRINSSKSNLLIVGLGVPLQEKWITDYLDRLDVQTVMAVGAFLDFTAGKVPRAPMLFRKARAEWIFRLLIEPRRMWKRYLWGNIIFFKHIAKYKFNSNIGIGKKDLPL